MMLTMNGYADMTPIERSAFDQWLTDAGILPDMRVYAMEFGEGHVIAHCYTKDENGKLYLVDATGVRIDTGRNKAVGDPDPYIAHHTETIAIETPPPSFVYGYCGEVFVRTETEQEIKRFMH